MNVNEALEMLKEKRGSHRYSCYVPSLDKECIFKPVTVAELKSLSKIALDENDENFLMAATALILDLCTEELDPKKLTELDRIKLILDIKQNNQFDSDIYQITCKDCEEIYSVELDTDSMIEKLSKAPSSKTLIFEEEGIKYELEINLPSVDLLCKFKKYVNNTIKKLDAADASDEERLKVEVYFVNYSPMLFVKSIKINEQGIDGFDTLSISDRDIFLNEFPAGIFEKITNAALDEEKFQITKRMRNATICPKCRTDNTYDPEVSDFFLI